MVFTRFCHRNFGTSAAVCSQVRSDDGYLSAQTAVASRRCATLACFLNFSSR